MSRRSAARARTDAESHSHLGSCQPAPRRGRCHPCLVSRAIGRFRQAARRGTPRRRPAPRSALATCLGQGLSRPTAACRRSAPRARSAGPAQFRFFAAAGPEDSHRRRRGSCPSSTVFRAWGRPRDRGAGSGLREGQQRERSSPRAACRSVTTPSTPCSSGTSGTLPGVRERDPSGQPAAGPAEQHRTRGVGEPVELRAERDVHRDGRADRRWRGVGEGAVPGGRHATWAGRRAWTGAARLGAHLRPGGGQPRDHRGVHQQQPRHPRQQRRAH